MKAIVVQKGAHISEITLYPPLVEPSVLTPCSQLYFDKPSDDWEKSHENLVNVS